MHAAVVKLKTVVLFGVGYVLGTRAGRERYAQLVALAQKASVRLDEYAGSEEAEPVGPRPGQASRGVA